jgi:hypothetical protein
MAAQQQAVIVVGNLLTHHYDVGKNKLTKHFSITHFSQQRGSRKPHNERVGKILLLMTRKLFRLKCIIVFTILFCGCNTSKMTFSNGDKWIPADYNPNTTVLLVQTFGVSAKAQEKIENYMAETYPYKYEFVGLKTINEKSGKYADIKKYKFAIVYSSHTTTSRDIQTGKSGPTVTGFDYNFIDRETGKEYPPTKKSASYAIMTFKPMINTLVKHFEK